jgi:hypothetical protein
MGAGLSGGGPPPEGWLKRSRAVVVVNGDAGDEGPDHLRVEQAGESDRGGVPGQVVGQRAVGGSAPIAVSHPDGRVERIVVI